MIPEIPVCQACGVAHGGTQCPKCGAVTECEKITFYADTRIRRRCRTCGHVEFNEPLTGISFGNTKGIPDNTAKAVLARIETGLNDWTDLAREGLGGSLQFSETDIISFLNCVRRPMYKSLCEKDLNEVILISSITQTLYEQCQALLSKVQASIKVERSRWDEEKRKRDKDTAKASKLVEASSKKSNGAKSTPTAAKSSKKSPQEKFFAQCLKIGMSKEDTEKQWALLQSLGKG